MKGLWNLKQERVLNSSGVEKIYTLTNGLTDGLTNIQKSDLYSEVARAKKFPVVWSHCQYLLKGGNQQDKISEIADGIINLSLIYTVILQIWPQAQAEAGLSLTLFQAFPHPQTTLPYFPTTNWEALAKVSLVS